MRTRFRSLSSSIAALLFLLMLPPQPAVAGTIDIVAVPSKFTPNAIVLHVDQTTTLHFVDTQGVHSISSRDLGIPSTVLSPGKSVDIAVTPKKPGTHVVHCEIICGSDHDSMTLTFTVES